VITGNTYFSILKEHLINSVVRKTDAEGKECLCDKDGNFLAGEKIGQPVLVEHLVPPLRLVIIGAGHVGQKLFQVARLLEWNVTVIDDRSAFCNQERFPGATTAVGDYVEELSKIESEGSAFCIATRGHLNDKECLRHLIRRHCRYLGMIGSKTKVTMTKKALQDEDPSVDFSILHAPIGLPINAQTPAEIAVSIAAQVIQETKGKEKQSEVDCSLIDYLASCNAPFIIARIIKKSGSAPREVGSSMAIFSDGSSFGTIGGGASEKQAIDESLKMFAEGIRIPQALRQDLSSASAGNLGMICGGNATILLTPFAGNK
jgi:xanthine dehydrogenase accessory factor